ncbi:hypothetical protein [Paenibacillus pini]|uniref:Lipoprotein n=1 Tax=Paenibacillus pini JCM 16418 TaxID=1236976 RepID=W7YJR9_9BACL|nr:hypothetical protein [Paenibacillus pini]GAF08762.1 hypothetical protein JCM16418_2867 [Paenibacillus pini JCM 16418]
MAIRTSFIILLTGIMLLICSCGKDIGKDIAIRDASDKSTNTIDTTAATDANPTLPEGVTISSIQHALEEYINYQLWFYPKKIEGNKGEFEPYIGKTIEAEIRIYDSEPNDVYLHTNIGNGLAIIKIDNGIVYCDGFINESDGNAPKGNFKVIDQLSLTVEQPHKPNYGHSPRKNKMIAAVETYISDFCKDMLSGDGKEKWVNAKIYIVDFYEYETGVSVWIVRQDGYAWYAPVALTEENGYFKAQGLKGYELKNINKLTPFDSGRYLFHKEITDAVKQYICK